MFNQILIVICMSIPGMIQGICMEYMMEKKNEKISRNTRLLAWLCWFFIGSTLNVFGGVIGLPNEVRQIAHWICIIAFLVLFYRDPMWRRVLGYIVLFFAYSLSEFTTVLAYQGMNIPIEVLKDRSHPVTVLIIAIGMLISFFTCMVVPVIWNKVFRQGKSLRYSWFLVLYALPFYVSVFLMVNLVYEGSIHAKDMLPNILGMGCLVTLMCVLFSQAEKESMENDLSEEKIKAELEKIHYNEVQKRRQQVKDLLNKNKTDLSKVKNYLQNSENTEVESVLKSLIERMNTTREYPFCEIPSINALLSEKAKKCDEYGITMTTDIKLSVDIPIKQIELCSVFSNLLDNAIRASKRVETGYIKLCAGIKNEYLIVKCENSSDKPPGLIPEGTGYGLKILEGIAAKYQGDFHIQYNDQKFKAQISLKI